MLMSTRNFNDSEIVARVLEGDVDVFEDLLTRHKGHVLKVVSRRVPYEHVEEVAHEAFIKAYQSLSMFKGTGAFKHWLTTIAVRTCYDFWRKHYKKRELAMSSLSEKHQEWLEQVLSSESPQGISEKSREKEAGEILNWALAKLSPEDRMVMELVYLEELSEREAANLMGWSIANVKVRAFRARKKMKKALDLIAKK